MKNKSIILLVVGILFFPVASVLVIFAFKKSLSITRDVLNENNNETIQLQFENVELKKQLDAYKVGEQTTTKDILKKVETIQKKEVKNETEFN
jgi:regulator of replication initiation timing